VRYRVLHGADDDVGAWIYARTRAQWVRGQGVAIGITSAESLVAGIAYTMFNGANVWGAIAAEPDHHGRWLSRSILRAIFDYPFRQLGCKRISALVYETNPVSQRFLTRLGFHREATLADAAPDGHMFVYALRAEDCRWLSR
jgi:RimJ/RimL family protein N-acetyltransferase